MTEQHKSVTAVVFKLAPDQAAERWTINRLSINGQEVFGFPPLSLRPDQQLVIGPVGNGELPVNAVEVRANTPALPRS